MQEKGTVLPKKGSEKIPDKLPGDSKLEEPSGFRFLTTLDGCPMFAPAYMGR